MEYIHTNIDIKRNKDVKPALQRHSLVGSFQWWTFEDATMTTLPQQYMEDNCSIEYFRFQGTSLASQQAARPSDRLRSVPFFFRVNLEVDLRSIK